MLHMSRLSMETVEGKMLNRIRGHRRGWCFFDNDFLDLARGPAVRQALSRMEQRSLIRRVMRGLYDYPRFSELLNQPLSPDLDQAARALARKFGWQIQISGEAALNYLGLSTQIPVRFTYRSSGPTRGYQIGERELRFQHARLKDFNLKHADSIVVIQALKALGQDSISESHLDIISQRFTYREIRKIRRDAQYATAWIYDILLSIEERYAEHLTPV